MWGPVSIAEPGCHRLWFRRRSRCSGRLLQQRCGCKRYGPQHRSSNKAATLRRRSSQLGAPREELVRTHCAMRSHHHPRASSATSSVILGLCVHAAFSISATVKGPLRHSGSPPCRPGLWDAGTGPNGVSWSLAHFFQHVNFSAETSKIRIQIANANCW